MCYTFQITSSDYSEEGTALGEIFLSQAYPGLGYLIPIRIH